MEANAAHSAVGAGDTFIAGILYCILCHPDWETEKKLRFAVELSTKKVQREGFDRLGADMLPDGKVS